MYLSSVVRRSLHVQFYLTLLDTYIPDVTEKEVYIHNIPSIKMKADFCFKWIESVNDLDELHTKEDRRKFLLNMICLHPVSKDSSSLQPLLMSIIFVPEDFYKDLQPEPTGYSEMKVVR